MTDLKWLGLGGNSLTGRIPAELGELQNLVQLVLGGNELSGEIPSELAEMSSVEYLELSEKQSERSDTP